MKFELNDFHRNTSNDELMNDLQRVVQLLGEKTVTIDEYNQHGRFHATTLIRRFGSWFTCLSLAGLEPSRSKIGITDEELFEEIENVWIRLGKQPSYSQMQDMAKFSMGTYVNRFGGWRNSLEAFVQYINHSDGAFPDTPKVSDPVIAHHTSHTVNWRMRFLVMKRDNFKCCYCGASPAKDPAVELQIDHILPWSKGGETVMENLHTLCKPCNEGKSNTV